MVMPLDSPQPTFALPPFADIEDTDEEKPLNGLPLTTVGSSFLPALVFGGASLSPSYNNDSLLESLVPFRTVRTALRYGITAFDTSAYYGPSEIVLGAVLKSLAPEFPRSSYKLMTKCGRYGVDREAFDYSPRTIRKSVERSLKRLNTDYLDVVYLHDVEFVAEEIMPVAEGNHLSALGNKADAYGLKPGNEARVWGKGDQIILNAFAELRKLQSEGVVRQIGITGYPLPTLLRLALLILHQPPYKPVDILLSYSHSNLQNAAFTAFTPHFRARAHVGQLISASPLNMGLLTPRPPKWHPAPSELRAATERAATVLEETGWEGGLPNIALGYAMREEPAFLSSPSAEDDSEKTSVNGNGNQAADEAAEAFAAGVSDIPVVVGLSSPSEVHQAVKAWRMVHEADAVALAQRKEMERKVIEIYQESGYANWSWASPPREA